MPEDRDATDDTVEAELAKTVSEPPPLLPTEEIDLSEAPTLDEDSQDVPLAIALGAAPLRGGPGSILGSVLGPYVVEKELGRGGMGVVYQAHHKETGGRVALKVLLAGAQATPKQRKRFLREATAAAKLDHPGIVKVMDHGEIDGLPFLALEFIEGHELGEELDTLGLDDLARVLALTARALDHAHQKQVLHRDIKPANILIRDEDEQPVITDFGLARELNLSSSLTKTGTTVGTPYYMAPEQIQNKKSFSPATDVYALGVILYQGLVGKHPFHEVQSPIELFHAIANQVPTPPGKHNHRVPEALERICMKAIEKEPGRRYPDAGAFADDLEAHLRGEVIGSEEQPKTSPLPVVVAILVLVAIAVGVAAYSSRTEDETAAPLAEKTAESEKEKTRSETPPPKTIVKTKTAKTGAKTKPSAPTNDPQAILEAAGPAPAWGPEGRVWADGLLDQALRLAKINTVDGLAITRRLGPIYPQYGRLHFVNAQIHRLRRSTVALAHIRAARSASVPYDEADLHALRIRCLPRFKWHWAADSLQVVHGKTPDDPGLAYACAEALFRSERHVQAIGLLSTDASLQQDWKAQHLLARALAAQGRKADAVEVLKRLAKKPPNHPAPFLTLGELLVDLNRRKEAERALAAAVEHLSRKGTVKRRLGSLRLGSTAPEGRPWRLPPELKPFLIADGHYRITSTVTLPRDETKDESELSVQIPPGSRLEFSPGVGLVIEGSLQVAGTWSDPVLFEGEAWAGLTLRGKGSRLTLRYTVLKGASKDRGGGILVEEGGYLRAEDSTIQGCRAKQGGGLLVAEGGKANLQRVRLMNNRAEADGGGAVSDRPSMFALNYCELRGNQAGGRGGGLFINRTSGSCYNARFIENRALRGGAVFTTSGYKLNNTFLHRNQAEQDGGGVSFDPPHSATLSLQHTWFLANTAAEGGGVGIGARGRAMIGGCLFSRNVAKKGGGGGLLIRPGSDEVTLRDCGFLKNKATSSGPDVVFAKTRFSEHDLIGGGLLDPARYSLVE